ncbi:hypothetical protein BGZ76_003832 [Entomortierella beljakovae]|nr:hypothetical protein BGZ76_003832 [Entomortierella beljakovae]
MQPSSQERQVLALRPCWCVMVDTRVLVTVAEIISPQLCHPPTFKNADIYWNPQTSGNPRCMQPEPPAVSKDYKRK